MSDRRVRPTDVDHQFDELVGDLDPALVVVTTAAGDERDGCLVGFHSQCGIAPRRYAVWLSKPNRTTRLAGAADCEWFAVHLVGADRHDLAEWFGTQSGDRVDPFAGWTWTPGPGGVPLLDACPDRFVGRRVSLSEVDADHLCLVLDPIEVQRGPRPTWLHLGDVGDVVAGHAPDEPVSDG
jgi:flavin reductase (DIM6/NTAB) family NADH-FMN oxidoreductase RutF